MFDAMADAFFAICSKENYRLSLAVNLILNVQAAHRCVGPYKP